MGLKACITMYGQFYLLILIFEKSRLVVYQHVSNIEMSYYFLVVRFRLNIYIFSFFSTCTILMLRLLFILQCLYPLSVDFVVVHLLLILFFETRSCYVAQTALELLVWSRLAPNSWHSCLSTGMHHCTQLSVQI